MSEGNELEKLLVWMESEAPEEIKSESVIDDIIRLLIRWKKLEAAEKSKIVYNSRAWLWRGVRK
jgi:hypothetical protein